MNTKTLLLVVAAVTIIAGGGLYFYTQPKNLKPLTDPAAEAPKEVVPSKTFIDYSDPSGFSFSYPDNISLSNRASENVDGAVDPNAYADLQLFSKDKNGSLNLKVVDTKFKKIEDWMRANEIPESVVPVEKKLGELPGFEVKTGDRITLVAIDQGILFTIDMPKLEEGFWGEVYEKVSSGFAFAAPEAATTQTAAVSSGDEVIFEGEEVVE